MKIFVGAASVVAASVVACLELLNMKKNLEISVRVKKIPRRASTMALSASGTKRDETKKDTKRTCRKHQKIIDKELINKLPRDIILIISKMHPLLIPPFTNKTLRRAVKDYLAGGDRKKIRY